MKYPLVTILTPVFNGERFIHRLLDSILIQDYPNLEFIIVDDGSTDKTKNIIESYIDKFKEKEISFRYVFQENQGQSFAIKNGLKYISGDYLTWPDSDDYYAQSQSISKLVEPILSGEYQISRCFPIYFNDNKMYEKEINLVNENSLFEDCLFAKNYFWFQPGCYMVNFSSFKKINPDLKFYVEKDAGQNWQFYLPILYYYKCKTIKEKLFFIYEREESHSRGRYKSSSEIERKYNAYINTLINTLVLLDLEAKLLDKYASGIIKQYKTKIVEDTIFIDRKFAFNFLIKNFRSINSFFKFFFKVAFLYKR